MEPLILKISTDFTSSPGPRYIDEGDFSGEMFRNTVLYPAYVNANENNCKLIVDLDGTAGFATSFLEEAFGGLIRINKVDYSDLISRLEIISNEEKYLIDDIKQYMEDAKKNQSTNL